MLATLCHVSSRKWAQNIRKDLPVLLIAGTADPVGDYGAGVRKVWAMLGDAGVQDMSCTTKPTAKKCLIMCTAG